jgi:hypothetical protein
VEVKSPIFATNKLLFMKSIRLVVILIFVCGFTVNGQKSAKAVYVELGGAGLASVNFDMRLQKKEDGLGFRVGVGGFSIESDYGYGSSKSSIVTVPMGLTYLLGKDQRNYFEIGAGATLVFESEKDNYNNVEETENFSSTFGHLHFGYRLQPVNGGFLFRAGITPVFGDGFFIPYFAGISFGYKF